MLQDLKSWFLANLLMIAGVALALIGGYAAWLHFVTVPRLEISLKAAEGNARIWEANHQTCTTANSGLAGAIQRQNDAITLLAEAGAKNRADAKRELDALRALMAGVPGALAAFKPNPARTDCENAATELAAFKAERGR